MVNGKKALLTGTGLTEPQQPMDQKFQLMPGHYWIAHPNGTRFVGLYEPPAWYAPGNQKAIPVKRDMILGPALPPEAAEQMEPLSQSCMKLAAVIVSMDQIVGPVMAQFNDISQKLAPPEKHEQFTATYNAYKAVLNSAFEGTVIEMSAGEMIQAAGGISDVTSTQTRAEPPASSDPDEA